MREPDRHRVSIAVVTATYDRLTLLPRLYDSLCAQTDLDFTWLVIDDASTDGTTSWVERCADRSPFPIVVLRNDRNRGKCASLNTAFDEVRVDFYLVVDSDDVLHPTAVRDVQSKASSSADAERVGAVFFAYQDREGRPLGAPPSGGDLVVTRAEFDQTYGKYDGCVGYHRRVVDDYRYPEFPPETYMGPTVLQMLMAPRFDVVFTDVVVGTAEYQQDGLTASGRRLRLANPVGMMTYTRLRAEQARTTRAALVAATMYYAYAHIAGRHRARVADRLRPSGRTRLACLVGRVGALPLAVLWRTRYAP